MGPGQASTEADGHRAWWAGGEAAAAFMGAEGRGGGTARNRGEGLVPRCSQERASAVAAAKPQVTRRPTASESCLCGTSVELRSLGLLTQGNGLLWVGPSSARLPRSLICVPFPGSSESSEFSEEMSSGLER